MKEELTSLMHMEFCQDEQERVEFAAMAIFAEVFEGKIIDFNDALKKYSISEAEFWENMPFKHILTFQTEPLEKLQKDFPYYTKEKDDKYKACKNKFEVCFLFGEICKN
jgi:hypothetical protein